jgi:hypothetical protein
MAHYAFLDENNIVTEVIVGIDETELIEGLDPETWYGNFRGQPCKRTSYNNNYRKQYAGIGFYFDHINDVFITPQPYPSWSLDEDFEWTPPILKPEKGSYVWDEDELKWVITSQPYPSWSLDESLNWQPPTPYPTDDNNYIWNESTLAWDLVE